MEGKEVRIGAPGSGLFAGATTGTSTGAVNSMHDSYTPLGGLSPMLHMMFGEVSPGGVGVGLGGMLILALLAVFIAGLMVGRTPEYLGKKIQAPEMKLVTLYILAMPFALLPFAAASVLLRSAATYQPGRARPVGGALQLRLHRQQQRLGVRLPGHRHPVVHDHPGHLDADRPLLHHHPGTRHRRFARRQAEGPRDRRHHADQQLRCSVSSSSASSSSSPA